MREFVIQLKSVQDVQDFVSLATTMGFPIQVEDSHHRVDGGSFMEMFCFDCGCYLTVTAQCSDEQFAAFYSAAERFRADN